MKERTIALMVCLALPAFGCAGDLSEDGPGFHKRTILTPAGVQKGLAARRVEPELKKSYPDLAVLSLPEAKHGGMPIEEALRKRRSIRSYPGKPVEATELSALLFAAQGITGERYGTKLRAAPSAGALYPIELYVIAHNVAGLAPGLYHYDPSAHSLTELKKGDLRAAVYNAGLRQRAVKEADLVIALTAVPARTTWKYGERGFRYIYMEAGHIAENILLQSVSLGFGAAPIGAFLDDRLNELLGIDGESEISLYLVAVGKL